MKVYIDGENFRHGIVDILKSGNHIDDARGMVKFPLRAMLEDALASRDLDIAYYASRIKMPNGFQPSQAILDKATVIKDFNRKWVSGLISQKIDHIKAGYLKVKTTEPCPNCGHTQEILQEKGVDVRIAVDLISDSHTTQGKTVALFSSDSDLIPALDRVKKSGIKIIYICFASSLNKAISSAANETVAISTAKARQLYNEATHGHKA